MLATCNDIYVLFGVLILALKTLDREVIEWLLTHKTASVPSHDNRFEWNEIVAEEVVSSGYVDVVEWLLKCNRSSMDCRHLLLVATEVHRLDMVEAVLEVMPDSHDVLHHVVSALRFATDRETFETIQLFIRKNKLDASALLDMLSFAVSKERSESVRALLAASPSHFAGRILVGHARTVSIQVAEILVEAGEMSDSDIGYALCRAVSSFNNDIVEYLVERDQPGCNARVAAAAKCAAECDNLRAMAAMLRTGCVSDADVEVALRVAVGNHNNNIVECIVKHKPCCNKNKAVTRAAACNNHRALETLLGATQNPGVANANKSRALYHAVQNKNDACATRLLEDELHPASPYTNVHTLAKAVANQDRSMLFLLLRGAEKVDQDDKELALVNALNKAIKMLRKGEYDEEYYNDTICMLATAAGHEIPC